MHAVYLATYSEAEAWSSDPSVCYADIEWCQRGPAPDLLVSEDGATWRRVDVGPASQPGQYLDGAIATDGNRVVVIRGVEGGVGTWTWPAGEPLPPAADRPEPPRAEIDLLEEGEMPELGRRYAVPLYIHCGMDWLSFGGSAWHRTGGEWDGSGPQPDDWPTAGQMIYGFATQVEEDRVEYSIGDGEVIATYERTAAEPPGCM